VPEIAHDIVTDLTRSAWVVERARALVYESWAAARPGFAASAQRTRERTRIIESALEVLGRGPDRGLAEAHSSWIRGCVPTPDETFGDLFLARLGTWVDAHLGRLLPSGSDRLRELGEEEITALIWPESLPPAPPFEPLDRPDLGPGTADARARVGVLGDLHVGSTESEELARAAIADLNRAGVDLVVQLGDITDHGNEREFATAAALLGELDAPWITTMGNHDAYSNAEKALSGPAHYARHFGRRLEGAVLELPGARVAVLDSVDVALAPFPPYDLVTGTFRDDEGGSMVRGMLTPPQHEILAEVAAAGDRPTFLFLHHPPQPFTGFPPIIFGLRDEDSGRLHATCDSGNVWGVFAGHTHRNHRGEPFDGVPVHEVAAPRDFPFGLALIDVFDDGYVFRFVQLSDEGLLRAGYARTSAIQRRYSLGAPHERAFEWRAAG
jgi:hypothetical protein